jgi:hypothetical protein
MSPTMYPSGRYQMRDFRALREIVAAHAFHIAESQAYFYGINGPVFRLPLTFSRSTASIADPCRN